MLARYFQISVIVIAVALATGYIVHRVAGSNNYNASCQFQLALPVTSTLPSSDILVFNRRQALDEIQKSELQQVWAGVSKDTGMSVGEIAGDSAVEPASDSSFAVIVTNASASGAVTLANALCKQYVKTLTKQVAGERDNEARGLRERLRYLEGRYVALHQDAIRQAHAGGHSSLPLPLYLQERGAILGAISHVKQYLIVTYSLPPYDISVISPSAGAAQHTTKPTLSKSLIVAGAAGLLACFLLILALETARGRPREDV